jgi:hypothetical protein
MADCHYKGKLKCHYCGKLGHKEEECWLKNKGKGKEKPLKERANMACNMEPSTSTKNVESDSNNSDFSCYWLADTATMSHISNQQNILAEYVEGREQINSIGETPTVSLGRGTVTLKNKCQ